MSLVGRTRILGVLAVLAVTAGPLVSVHAATGTIVCRYKKHIQYRQDGWYEIAGPEYDVREGPATILQMETSPSTTKRLYVSNGVSVKRTTDDGCTWHTRLFPAPDTVADNKPPEADPLLQNNVIADMKINQYLGDRDEMWVASYDNANGVARPHISASKNADEESASFVDLTANLPTLGQPKMLALARLHGAAYLLLNSQVPTVAPPSTDVTTGGITLYHMINAWDENPNTKPITTIWQKGRLPAGFTDLDGLVVDPNVSTKVWAWQGSKIAFAPDGGVVWQKPIDVGGDVGTIRVQRNPEGDNSSIAYVFANHGESATSTLMSTADDGKTWTRGQAPGPVLDGAVGLKRDLLAVSTPVGAFGYDLRLKKWVSFSPAKLGSALADLKLVGVRPTTMFAHTEVSIFRRQLYPPDLFMERPARRSYSTKTPYLPPLLEIPKSLLKSDSLTCAADSVTVKPGETADLPCEYKSKPHPLGLDVYFLVDTTTSMAPSIAGLRKGMAKIVKALTIKGVDAQFGVGQVQDIGHAAPHDCDPTPGSTTPACTYRRVLPISPPGPDLDRALSTLKDMGAGDEAEAQTIGLQHAVTRAGIPGIVDPNQDAGFRSDAISVILLVTDAKFHQDNSKKYPTIEQAARTLTQANVYMAGIVAHTNNDLLLARDDVEKTAELAKTLAPATGVDCNGDGFLEPDVDVPPYGPLVCVSEQAGSGDNTEAVNITPAIISLLLGIPDPGRMRVEPLGNTTVVKSMAGTYDGIFNMKAENHLKFRTGFTCLPEQDGLDFPIALEGTTKGQPTARAFVTVHCRALKVEPPQIFIPPIILPPPAAPLMPAPPNPVPNPNPPNNPGPNLNPNSGFASQEEQQFQLAAVGQSEGEQQQDEEATELAMSAVDRKSAAAAPIYLGAALMTSIAVGVAMRRRTQRAPARVRI